MNIVTKVMYMKYDVKSYPLFGRDVHFYIKNYRLFKSPVRNINKFLKAKDFSIYVSMDDLVGLLDARGMLNTFSLEQIEEFIEFASDHDFKKDYLRCSEIFLDKKLYKDIPKDLTKIIAQYYNAPIFLNLEAIKVRLMELVTEETLLTASLLEFAYWIDKITGTYYKKDDRNIVRLMRKACKIKTRNKRASIAKYDRAIIQLKKAIQHQFDIAEDSFQTLTRFSPFRYTDGERFHKHRVLLYNRPW